MADVTEILAGQRAMDFMPGQRAMDFMPRSRAEILSDLASAERRLAESRSLVDQCARVGDGAAAMREMYSVDALDRVVRQYRAELAHLRGY